MGAQPPDPELRVEPLLRGGSCHRRAAWAVLSVTSWICASAAGLLQTDDGPAAGTARHAGSRCQGLLQHELITDSHACQVICPAACSRAVSTDSAYSSAGRQAAGPARKIQLDKRRHAQQLQGSPAGGGRRTCDPGQHGLEGLCPGPADDSAHDVLLFCRAEVLRKQGPQLLLLSPHMLLQGGPHSRTHALQLPCGAQQLRHVGHAPQLLEHLRKRSWGVMLTGCLGHASKLVARLQCTCGSAAMGHWAMARAAMMMPS